VRGSLLPARSDEVRRPGVEACSGAPRSPSACALLPLDVRHSRHVIPCFTVSIVHAPVSSAVDLEGKSKVVVREPSIPLCPHVEKVIQWCQ